MDMVVFPQLFDPTFSDPIQLESYPAEAQVSSERQRPSPTNETPLAALSRHLRGPLEPKSMWWSSLLHRISTLGYIDI